MLFFQEHLENNFEVCTEIDKCLYRLEFDDKLAVATSRLHVQTLPLYEHIFCFDQTQNIHNFLNVFMIRSDFQMNFSFNNLLKMVVVSGLTAKFQRDLKIHQEKSITFSEAHRINLIDFYFVFVFATFLIILIIIAIALEFIIYYKSRSVNATKVWKTLDKIICGRRFFFLLHPKNDDIIIPFTN